MEKKKKKSKTKIDRWTRYGNQWSSDTSHDENELRCRARVIHSMDQMSTMIMILSVLLGPLAFYSLTQSEWRLFLMSSRICIFSHGRWINIGHDALPNSSPDAVRWPRSPTCSSRTETKRFSHRLADRHVRRNARLSLRTSAEKRRLTRQSDEKTTEDHRFCPRHQLDLQLIK